VTTRFADILIFLWPRAQIQWLQHQCHRFVGVYVAMQLLRRVEARYLLLLFLASCSLIVQCLLLLLLLLLLGKGVPCHLAGLFMRANRNFHLWQSLSVMLLLAVMLLLLLLLLYSSGFHAAPGAVAWLAWHAVSCCRMH
jgi:hypothetical protein